ncbi:MAG TPA: hypothetical protein VJU58_10090 [Microbacterium sp.]|nr:hypothetical protein [Microbacterium sp.]
MITKAEAQQWRQSFISQMPARLEAAIKAAALSGQTSLVFPYAPVPSAQVDNFITNTMTPAGWTCVNDAANSTLTVS